MRAAQLVGSGVFEVVDVPDPVPMEGEVLVEMLAASVCGSDLHRVFGAPEASYPLDPGRPGHEGIGTVVASRSRHWQAGDVVLTVPMPGTGGCYATLQAVGESFLVALPASGDPKQLLMAQQLGTVVYGFHRYWPTGTTATGLTAAIIGAGSAGLFALQLARLAGFSTVVVSDLEPARLEIAKRLGADVIVRAPGESFVEAVLDVTDGEGAALVVEAAGFDSCRADCIAAVRRFGRVGYFGLPERGGLMPFPFEQAFRRACSIELAGNAQLEPGLTSFIEALELIASGRVVVDDLVEARYRLEEIQVAMNVAFTRGAAKVSIDLRA